MVSLPETLKLSPAAGRFVHVRPKLDQWGVPLEIQWLAPGVVDLATAEVLGDETVHNVITTVGRDFLHSQGYNTSGGASNGFCYVGLSNDTLTETSASTTLSNEIAANGLSRAVGAYAHTTGTTTTTISKTFTCTTTSQAAQKAALFTASSAGTMNHALAFTQRTLQVGDQLAVTFTITLS